MDGWGDYDWIAWVGVAVVLGIVEVTTLDLMFAMLAVGAFAGALTGLVTDNVLVQALVALLVATAMLLLVRPVALRHLRTPHAIRTGVAALVGEKGLVLEPVDAESGRVKLKGEIWSARSFDPARTIEPGHYVEVIRIDGATAVVYESEI